MLTEEQKATLIEIAEWAVGNWQYHRSSMPEDRIARDAILNRYKAVPPSLDEKRKLKRAVVNTHGFKAGILDACLVVVQVEMSDIHTAEDRQAAFELIANRLAAFGYEPNDAGKQESSRPPDQVNRESEKAGAGDLGRNAHASEPQDDSTWGLMKFALERSERETGESPFPNLSLLQKQVCDEWVRSAYTSANHPSSNAIYFSIYNQKPPRVLDDKMNIPEMVSAFSSCQGKEEDFSFEQMEDMQTYLGAWASIATPDLGNPKFPLPHQETSMFMALTAILAPCYGQCYICDTFKKDIKPVPRYLYKKFQSAGDIHQAGTNQIRVKAIFTPICKECKLDDLKPSNWSLVRKATGRPPRKNWNNYPPTKELLEDGWHMDRDSAARAIPKR